MSEKWLIIGIVGKAHGLRGAFFLSDRDSPLLANSIKLIKIGADLDKAQSYQIIRSFNSGRRTVLSCQELKSCDQVEPIRGQTVWCRRQDVGLDEQSEYLWDDIIGREVFASDGVRLGVVKNMANFGASDIIEVADGLGKVVAIPFVDSYVDMNFAPTEGSLSLKVTADILSDTWESER